MAWQLANCAMRNERETLTAAIDAELSRFLRELAAREDRKISSLIDEAPRVLRDQRREQTEDLQFVADFMSRNRGAFEELARE
jgi:uncharacterized protein YbaR (Trm112 family)